MSAKRDITNLFTVSQQNSLEKGPTKTIDWDSLFDAFFLLSGSTSQPFAQLNDDFEKVMHSANAWPLLRSKQVVSDVVSHDEAAIQRSNFA